jgi:hypothetical protein
LNDGPMRACWTILLAIALSVIGFAVIRSAEATDLWMFDGLCTDALVKMGSPYEDMGRVKGTKVSCDAALLLELDNGRKLIQFAEKRGTQVTPLGFAGSSYEPQGNMLRLTVDKIYPRRAMGASPEETFARSADGGISGAEGFCFFAARDFRNATDLSCIAKLENENQKFIFKAVFKINKVTYKPNVSSP